MSDDNGYQDALKDLGSKIIAAALQCDVGMLPHPLIQSVKRDLENEQILITLSQLSGLPIDEVNEKVQQHPWAIGTVLDFYRIYGKFPQDIKDD